jgi:hypothetical protein
MKECDITHILLFTAVAPHSDKLQIPRTSVYVLKRTWLPRDERVTNYEVHRCVISYSSRFLLFRMNLNKNGQAS